MIFTLQENYIPCCTFKEGTVFKGELYIKFHLKTDSKPLLFGCPMLRSTNFTAAGFAPSGTRFHPKRFAQRETWKVSVLFLKLIHIELTCLSDIPEDVKFSLKVVKKLQQSCEMICFLNKNE